MSGVLKMEWEKMIRILEHFNDFIILLTLSKSFILFGCWFRSVYHPRTTDVLERNNVCVCVFNFIYMCKSVSCRSLVDRRGFLWNCKLQIKFLFSMYVCMHVRKYGRVCVCVCVCVWACVCVLIPAFEPCFIVDGGNSVNHSLFCTTLVGYIVGWCVAVSVRRCQG